MNGGGWTIPSVDDIYRLTTEAITKYNNELSGNIIMSIGELLKHRALLSVYSMLGTDVNVCIGMVEMCINQFRPEIIAQIKGGDRPIDYALRKYFNPRDKFTTVQIAQRISGIEREIQKNIMAGGTRGDILSNDPMIRKHEYEKWITRCPVNDKLFVELFNLRRDLAIMRGYLNANSATDELKLSVDDFLVDQYNKHIDLAKQGLDLLMIMWRRWYPNAVEIPADSLDWLCEQFDSGDNVCKVSFDKAVEVVIEHYRRRFGLTFQEIPRQLPYGSAWSVVGRNCRGELHIDGIRREGKYTHHAELPVGDGIAVVIMSLPSEITSADVMIIAHEIGHAISDIISDGPFLTRGTNMPVALVEAPAVYLEKTVIAAIRRQLFGRVTDPIPESVYALRSLPKITMAMFDRYIHANPPVNIDELRGAWLRFVRMNLVYSEEDRRYRSFGHLAGGYATQYYAYTLADHLSTNVINDNNIRHILENGGRDWSWAVVGSGNGNGSVTGSRDKIKDLDAYPASQFETYCRQRIERLTGKKFPSVYPDWLMYKGRKLELDGYCAELFLAFECQGPQHTKMTSMDKTEDQYKRRLENDAAKARLCKEHGVGLIHIDYRVPKMLLGSYIRSRIYDVAVDWRKLGQIVKVSGLGFLSTKAPDYVPEYLYEPLV